MLYELRLKGRQKQGECSVILTMTFLIIILSMFTVNLVPLIYVSVLKPYLTGGEEVKVISLAVSSGVLLLIWWIMSALSYGSDRFMLKRAEDKTAGAGDIFYYFAPRKAFELSSFLLKFGTIKIMVILFLSVPVCFCAGVCLTLAEKGFSAAVCSIFAVFSLTFLCVGIDTYYKVADSCFLVRYRYIKGEYLNFVHLLSQSQRDVETNISRLRKLKVSFSGWFLLALLIIPMPYVWCYYRQTKACFASEML